ncbi:hypothetical protein BDW60DRAFT_164319 [Aspergillus nidulans var. acristatus]
MQVISDQSPRPQTSPDLRQTQTPDRDIQFSAPDMTNSEMDEVKANRKLNFISWKREFERAAKANDAFEYLTGEEVVPSKPRKEDYFAKPGDADIRRSPQTKKISTPTVDDGDEADDAQAVLMTTNNSLRWQIDYNEHKNAKEKMKLASKLLDSWVSDGIKIEIEDCTNAKEAYDLIKKRYAVTHERARDSLLNQLSLIKARRLSLCD